MSTAVLVVQSAHSASVSTQTLFSMAPTARIAQLAANPPLAVFTVISDDSNSAIQILSQLALRDDIDTAFLFIGGDAFTFGNREKGEIVSYLPTEYLVNCRYCGAPVSVNLILRHQALRCPKAPSEIIAVREQFRDAKSGEERREFRDAMGSAIRLLIEQHTPDDEVKIPIEYHDMQWFERREQEREKHQHTNRDAATRDAETYHRQHQDEPMQEAGIDPENLTDLEREQLRYNVSVMHSAVG